MEAGTNEILTLRSPQNAQLGLQLRIQGPTARRTAIRIARSQARQDFLATFDQVIQNLHEEDQAAEAAMAEESDEAPNGAIPAPLDHDEDDQSSVDIEEFLEGPIPASIHRLIYRLQPMNGFSPLTRLTQFYRLGQADADCLCLDDDGLQFSRRRDPHRHGRPVIFIVARLHVHDLAVRGPWYTTSRQYFQEQFATVARLTAIYRRINTRTEARAYCLGLGLATFPERRP